MASADNRVRTFSWRLNERTITCPVPRNDSARWTCAPHADGHGPGGEAPGSSDQAVPGTLAGGRFQICRPYGQTPHPNGDANEGD